MYLFLQCMTLFGFDLKVFFFVLMGVSFRCHWHYKHLNFNLPTQLYNFNQGIFHIFQYNIISITLRVLDHTSNTIVLWVMWKYSGF